MNAQADVLFSKRLLSWSIFICCTVVIALFLAVLVLISCFHLAVVMLFFCEWWRAGGTGEHPGAASDGFWHGLGGEGGHRQAQQSRTRLQETWISGSKLSASLSSLLWSHVGCTRYSWITYIIGRRVYWWFHVTFVLYQLLLVALFGVCVLQTNEYVSYYY